MIVTTAYRTNEELVIKAKSIAGELEGKFVNRGKRTINDMLTCYNQEILVVEKESLQLFADSSETPFFFHPNSAMFRIKRLAKGERDPFIDACQLSVGTSILDCTLGLGSDAIVASYVIKDSGKIVGLEENRNVSYIVAEGLLSYRYPLDDEFEKALHRINVINMNATEYLKLQEDNSVDVVYIDPMFTTTVEESKGIDPLRSIVSQSELAADFIEEAKRVARKRVVLKDHFKSNRFEDFSFKRIIRKTSKFHFGVIEIEHLQS